tara:strand:+ start:13623 stop:13862 length:240 start_codon:yes stop_codon:yes gene_type:complete
MCDNEYNKKLNGDLRMSKTKDYVMSLEEKFYDNCELAVVIGNCKETVLAQLEAIRSTEVDWVPAEELVEYVDEAFTFKS